MSDSNNAPWRNEELLRQKYVVNREQPKEIIEEFGCSKATFYKWLGEFGLKEEREKPYRDEETLETLYVDQKLPLSSIAERFNTDASTIRYWLQKFGIETRNAGGKDDNAPWKNEEKLREWYHDKKMSTYEIADGFDVTPSGISKQLSRHDIEKRRSNREMFPSPHLNHSGHERVENTYDGEKYHVFIHQLVAIAHGADAYKVFGDLSHVIHHKNSIEWDNRPENVELVTQSEHKKIHRN